MERRYMHVPQCRMITDYFKRANVVDPISGELPSVESLRGPAHPYAMADGHKLSVVAHNLPELLSARKRRRLTCINVNCNKQLVVHNGQFKRLHCQHAPDAKATARRTGEGKKIMKQFLKGSHVTRRSFFGRTPNNHEYRWLR